jgi:hypothetical protein
MDMGDEDELFEGEIAGGNTGDRYLGFFIFFPPYLASTSQTSIINSKIVESIFTVSDTIYR